MLFEARFVGVSRSEGVLRERGRGDEEREAREADRSESRVIREWVAPVRKNKPVKIEADK